MNTLPDSLREARFSHLYIEREARHYPIAKRVMERFPAAVRVDIEHYKEVFARPRQRFAAQKTARKLILAVQKSPLVYPGAKVCHDFGHARFFYTSSVLNCVYDCEYCFLQGMFPSANIVVFVNIEDSFAEVERLLADGPVYLSVSYESDLLAFEPIVPLASQWIEFARAQPELTLEIRTKSAAYAAIRQLTPAANVVLAWTMTPERVARSHEPLTPAFSARLHSAKQALEDGWKVRICFDPMLYIEDWQSAYGECVKQVFAALPPQAVHDVSIGTFRAPKDYLKTMRKQRPDSALLHYPFVNENGVMGYPKALEQEMIDFMRESVARHFPAERIFTLSE